MITKDHIIKTATKLFLKNGIKSVTIDRIVKELHTSKRTVYNHFKDKTALLTACLATYHATIKKENEQLIDCLLYTSPSPRDLSTSRMPSSA